MKILLMWGEKESEMRTIFDALHKDGHDIVYWVGGNESEHLTPPGAPFHDFFGAWAAQRARGLENEYIEPASRNLIDSMAPIESHILTMMNKRYNTAGVDERKHVYFTMLAYWNYVIERYKPDCVVYGVIPHSNFGNIVDELAKKKGIKRICLDDTWVGTHTLIYHDFWKGSDELRDEIKKLEHKKVSVEDLCEGFQDYWREQMGTGGVEPVYATEQRKMFEGWGGSFRWIRIITRTYRSGSFLRLATGYIRRLFARDLSHEYAEVVKKPDWNVPYVYFPLSQQPERTSSPQGLVYADLLLAAETLAAALPKGWELWVKEHPTQWWLRTKRFSSVRYPGYYHRLANIPNVRVVPIHTDTFALSEKAGAVAVTTGTAGWEALLKGKCPLMFGIPWWRDCPGVYPVHDVASCRKAIEEIQNGAKADKDDMLRFLFAVDKVSIHAHFETTPSWKENDVHDRNLPGIIDRVCSELRKMEA